MSCDKEALARLSDEQIVSFLLGAIWRWMDVGGVSGGRHIRACLLEAAMDMYQPRVRLEVLGDGFSKDGAAALEFLKEAMRRRPYRPKLVFRRGVMLRFVSDLYLSILLLRALRSWYKQDLKWNNVGFVPEMELLQGVFRLIGEPEHSPNFSRIAMIQEARERIRKQYRSTAVF